jgi:hypothetical protein
VVPSLGPWTECKGVTVRSQPFLIFLASGTNATGKAGFAYRDQPSYFLRQQAPGLSLGRAVWLAEREGRIAVHLAELGHRVVAKDLSSLRLAKARQLATRRGDKRDGVLRPGDLFSRSGQRGAGGATGTRSRGLSTP